MNAGDDLNRREQRDATRRSAPRALVVFEAIRQEAEHELNRSSAQLGWSGLAAGLSMGFSFLVEVLLLYYLSATELGHGIASVGYSVGFIIVILARQQLFTENTLTPVLQVLHQRSMGCLMHLLRLWAVVLVANLLGGFLFAWALASGNVLDARFTPHLLEVSRSAFGTSFWVDFLRAVFAGWLIALMVWLLPYAYNSRLAVIVILTTIIGLAGFPHVIAGSIEAFYAVIVGARDWGELLWEFFIPALTGNIVGGVALVSVINYAQVAAGDD